MKRIIGYLAGLTAGLLTCAAIAAPSSYVDAYQLDTAGDRVDPFLDGGSVVQSDLNRAVTNTVTVDASNYTNGAVKLISDVGVAYGVKQFSNTPLTIDVPKSWAIAEGIYTGHGFIEKFGHNSGVGATLEEVWDGSAAYVYITNASTLYISSSDNADSNVFEVTGLDASWAAQVTNVTSAGLSFVAVDGTWMRVFRVKNMGSISNIGTIYIADDNTDAGGNGIPDTLADVKAQIQPALNQTLMAIWSVAAGKTCYMTSFYGSTSSTKATEVHVYVRPFGGVFQIKRIITIFEGSERIPWDFPLSISAKSDVVVKASTEGGGGEVSAGFAGWTE